MPRAILSVSDKTGLVELAASLSQLGWTLIASGGTAQFLRENDLAVIDAARYTGSPEILDGRVKTLHPAIHGGLLARSKAKDQQELISHGWDTIDLAVVNLYPFEETIAQPGVNLTDAIENIDIGGVALIRAAAKNFERVTLLCDPADYGIVLKELEIKGSITPETRRTLAVKGFQTTARYDAAISQYLDPEGIFMLQAYPVQQLRYGENPHQSASLYAFKPGAGPLGGRVLQGKELTYNNLLDLNAAWQAAIGFDKTAIVIVKHLSPCGIACSDQLCDAFQLALACDPVSAYGGVIASNRPVEQDTAQAIGNLFVECIAAPAFSEEARSLLSRKKNCRLLEIPENTLFPKYELRSIQQGLLKQSIDLGDPPDTHWKVASSRQPSDEEWKSLRFAWKACQYVKSNAILLARGEASVGIGSGQPNRIDSVRIAIQRAGEKSRGAVMASEAFFPFPDCIQTAAQAGITAVIFPGGSIRDRESLEAAEDAGLAVVLTGVRHFRH